MDKQFQVRSTQKINGPHHLTPLLERIYAARGVTSIKQLDYGLMQLIDPDDILHVRATAAFLAECIQQQKYIVIVGDYDADGATSTALMVKGLKALGCTFVDYVLPDRVREGYGLSASLVRRVLDLRPDVVITVDTGISSHDGINTLKNAAIDVVITDHHLPADQLPQADFIVNPNAFDKARSPHGRCLAGVGVAFYVVLSIRTQLRSQNYFSNACKEPNLALLLDLVALGTIADLVPLDHLNRVLVAQGLQLIQHNKCCDGISSLFKVSHKKQQQASHHDLAYAIAPRINAAGRIDNMALGVQCLLATGQEADTLAGQLNDINMQRRALQAEIQIDTDVLLSDLVRQGGYPKGIVLCNKAWHEGVVGIVASKIKVKTHRPVIVFAYADNGQLKGSGRSIEGIHLRDVLDLIDKRHKGLVIKFGGHAMAAGLSIAAEHLTDFQHAFNNVLSTWYDDTIFTQNRLTDGLLNVDELTLETAEILHQAGPWGQLFEEPEFMGTFEVVQQKVLKEQHLKFVLKPKDATTTLDAIAFFCDEAIINTRFEQVHICYTMSINEFREQRSLQLIIQDFMVLD